MNLFLRAGLLQNMTKNGTVRHTELQNTIFSLKIQPEGQLRPLESWKTISKLTDFKIYLNFLIINLKSTLFKKD